MNGPDIHIFRSINQSLCPTGHNHAMNYFASLGIFMSQGRRAQTRGNKITASKGLLLKNYFQLEHNLG